MTQTNTKDELILNKIKEFTELTKPLDCMNTIIRMFFEYLQSSSTNKLTQIELVLIEQTIAFLSDCQKGIKPEISLQPIVFGQRNRIYCRTGLNKILFNYLKNSVSESECSLQLEEIQNIESLFDFFNEIEQIMTNEIQEKEVTEIATF